MIEKRKRQPTATPGLSRYIMGSLPFEFVSDHSLEECADRLHRQTTPFHLIRSAISPVIVVDMTPINPDVYQFVLRRGQYRRGSIVAAGSLERYEGTMTLVRGSVVQHDSLVLYFIVLPFILLALLPLAPIIIIGVLLWRYQKKQDIINLIRFSVGASQY